MIELALLAARRELADRADANIVRTIAYCRKAQIRVAEVGAHIGAITVGAVAVHPRGMFDYGHDGGEAIDALIFEAFGADAEHVIDLVAWPLPYPERPMSMFGRVGLVGIAEAANPATFFMGAALRLHTTPLAWLQSGARGAAIVARDLAARQLRDLLGPIAVASIAEGRSVRALIDGVPRPEILVPQRRAA